MQEELLFLLITVLMGVITLFFIYLTKWVNLLFVKVEQEVKGIRDKEERELLINLLDDLNNLTRTVIYSIEQYVGKSIRESIAEGTSTRNELEELAELAEDKILEYFGDDNIDILKKYILNLEDYVKDLIESEILKMKQEIYNN